MPVFCSATWFKVKDNVAEFAATLLEFKFGSSLEFLKNIIAPILRSKIQNLFRIEGTGNHTDEENLTILRSDLQAIETYLGDKDFFFGDKPSLVDIMVFAHVAAFYYLPWHHLAKDLVDSEFPKIVEHVHKIEKKLFSDFKFGQ
uniref:Metaxin glutathione S-transferase domain-containing protein n=1 Tax=Acrobeloides nanus TaxID=290746 RepID=A0A914CBV0_9BILA